MTWPTHGSARGLRHRSAVRAQGSAGASAVVRCTGTGWLCGENGRTGVRLRQHLRLPRRGKGSGIWPTSMFGRRRGRCRRGRRLSGPARRRPAAQLPTGAIASAGAAPRPAPGPEGAALVLVPRTAASESGFEGGGRPAMSALRPSPGSAPVATSLSFQCGQPRPARAAPCHSGPASAGPLSGRRDGPGPPRPGGPGKPSASPRGWGDRAGWEPGPAAGLAPRLLTPPSNRTRSAALGAIGPGVRTGMAGEPIGRSGSLVPRSLPRPSPPQPPQGPVQQATWTGKTQLRHGPQRQLPSPGLRRSPTVAQEFLQAEPPATG